MTHLLTWIGMLLGVVVYRTLFPTTASIMEHATGVYYAGFALLVHWILTGGLRSRKSVSTGVSAGPTEAGTA